MLKLAYIALSIVMAIILYLIGSYAIIKSTTDPKSQTKLKRRLLLGLLLWHLYIFLLGSSGFLVDLSFPPKFALMLILPAFIFTGSFLYIHRKSNWIQSIPYHWLPAYQSFRVIIETIFVFTVLAGILNETVTIKGYNYDMVFASTALIVAFIAYRAKSIPKKLLLIWNYIGLGVIAIIIVLFQTAIYLPEIYGPNMTSLSPDIGWYPYVLVPGFLMPSAVFIHVLSLIQLKYYES